MPITSTSRIEALESRIAPAVVNVTLVNGALSFTNNDPAGVAILLIAIDANNYAFAGANGTVFHKDGVAVDSDALLLTGPIKSITATLGGGEDVLSISGVKVAGDVTINGGDGKNNIGFRDVTINGSLNVTGGTGNDAIFFEEGDVTVKKDMTLTLGEGANAFQSAVPSSQIGGNFSYTGGSGLDDVRLTGVLFRVGGNMTVQAGSGEFFSKFAALNFTINKKLTIDTSGSLAVDGVTVDIQTNFGKIGEMQVTDGAGNLFLTLAVSGKKGSGTANVVTGAGTATFTIGSPEILTSAAQSGSAAPVVIDASASSATFGSMVGGRGGLTFTGSALGADTVNILSAGGPLIIDAQDGDNTVSGLMLGAGKTLQMSGGTGKDTFSVVITSAKVGSVTVDTGSGEDSTSFTLSAGTVTGAVTITSEAVNGPGTSSSKVVASFLNMTIGSFNFTSTATKNEVLFGASPGTVPNVPQGSPLANGVAIGLTVKKSFQIKTAGGEDKVDFGAAVNLKIGQGMTLDLGDGKNTTQLNTVNFTTKSLSVIGGAGDDGVGVLSQSNTNLGAVSIALGDGNNGAALLGSLNVLRASSLTYVSTNGVGVTDFLFLARVQVSGKVDVKSGAGAVR